MFCKYEEGGAAGWLGYFLDGDIKRAALKKPRRTGGAQTHVSPARH